MRLSIRIVGLVIFSNFVLLSKGQRTTEALHIQWKEIGINKPYAVDCVFEEDAPHLPRITKTIILPFMPGNLSVQLSNIESEPSEKQFRGYEIHKLGNDYDLKYETGYINHKPVVLVTIGLASNKGGQLHLLKSATITIDLHEQKSTQAQKTVKANSALKTGNWRRIKINGSGIYKITFEQLQDWGMSNPENVRVYGTGGLLLSKRNNANDSDDLYENPVYMETNGDGIFNSGDYILFYGQGMISWSYDKPTNRYSHIKHPYSDEGNYFITTSLGAGKRIVASDFNSSAHDYLTSTGDITLVWDDDLQNPNATGRLKFGELLPPGEKRNISFNFPAPPVSDEDVTIQTQVVGYQSSQEPQCSFEFKVGETQIHRSFLIGYHPDSYSEVWDLKYQTSRKKLNVTPLTVTAQYIATSIAARGSVDFIRATARVNLNLTQSNSLFFADSKNIVTGTIKQYQLEGSNVSVWNITDPLNPIKMNVQVDGNTNRWKYTNDQNQFYCAFNNSGISNFTDLGTLANQDIHGLPVPDMIIITAPLFRQEAERLAEFRRTFNNLQVVVLEPQIIYNEFSSGIPDVTAIRNMARMFYLRSGESSRDFKYLLLIGDGSYDNKWAATTNNHILTYQDINSLDKVASFESDDYYGLLDNNEGGQDLYGGDTFNGFLDIAVGRLPVETLFEAQTLINKIIEYSRNPKLDSWKNELTFLSDDADGGDFVLQQQAYELSQIIVGKYPWFNNNLIFMDAYQQVSTPAGQRYPAVREAINSIIHRGTLLVNYTGHGSPNQLAHEAVIDKTMVNNWKNSEYLPFFMTASCEIARYDDHKKKSIGELILLNPNGGAVSMFTTTRAVFVSGNHSLSTRFYNRVFERKVDGNYSTLGEIMVDSKNQMTSGGTNHRKFTLLGDPSMKLIIPPYRVMTDSINGNNAQMTVDTIGALQKVTIHGRITDTLGNHMPNYEGIIYPTVYDKPKEKQTLNNDGTGEFSFNTQDNILYKGKATVTGGKFSFEFIVPLDIDYDFGRGKIGYYAQDGNSDAQGAFRFFFIGGSSNNTIADAQGPEINLFMNDTNFVSGSSTNETPLLIAQFFDQNGINTTGNGIGHEITARLKHDLNNVLVLNNHYESDINSYQSGKLQYQLLDLPDGENQITLRAWDILNNYTEKKLDFVVANTEKAALSHVLNYPNPFTTHTKFLFEHNQPHVPLEITIQVFTVTGRLIKTLQTTMQGNAYQLNPLTWDGRDDFGDRLGRGVYIYAVKIKTPDGKTDTKFERLVILK